MATTNSILTTIQQRYSCRNYASRPLSADIQGAITGYLEHLPYGPFQKKNRFKLIASTHQDRTSLNGLGTYGFIKNPTAFIIGASEEGPLALEDFGYRMEQIILYLTRLGLGTCWLGGTFTRSAFAQKIAVSPQEILPAVCSLGYPEEEARLADAAPQLLSRPKERLGWEALFFTDQFGSALRPENSGPFAAPLEMVRLAPSASNKQPWRILRAGERWHFYLQRSRGYRELALGRFTGIADMQRIDMGIALCHFELAVQDCGLAGQWKLDDPRLEMPDALTSYVISWIPKQA